MLRINKLNSLKIGQYLTEDDYYSREPHAEIEGDDIEKELPNNRKIKGYDFTFTPHKSVSIAAEVLGDERVLDAHKSAIREVEQRIREDIQVRIKENGRVKVEKAQGFIAAYTHHLSRAEDPNLHTHLIVINRAIDKNGKDRAIDARVFYRKYREYSNLYNRALAQELRSRGIEVRFWKNKYQEVPYIPMAREVIKEFSKRRADIEKMAGKNAPWHERELASLKTRDRKRKVDLTQKRREWRERLAEIEKQLGRKISINKHYHQRDYNYINLSACINTKSISSVIAQTMQIIAQEQQKENYKHKRFELERGLERDNF